jgi:hypothetical protein
LFQIPTKDPHLFPEVPGLDKNILSFLSTIGDSFAIVVYEVEHQATGKHHRAVYLVRACDVGGGHHIYGHKLSGDNSAAECEALLEMLETLVRTAGGHWPRVIKRPPIVAIEQ